MEIPKELENKAKKMAEGTKLIEDAFGFVKADRVRMKALVADIFERPDTPFPAEDLVLIFLLAKTPEELAVMSMYYGAAIIMARLTGREHAVKHLRTDEKRLEERS